METYSKSYRYVNPMLKIQNLRSLMKEAMAKSVQRLVDQEIVLAKTKPNTDDIDIGDKSKHSLHCGQSLPQPHIKNKMSKKECPKRDSDIWMLPHPMYLYIALPNSAISNKHQM